MTRKFKFFSFFFIFLFILFVLGAISVGKENTNPFIQAIESTIPKNIKIFLKETVFIIPILKRKVEEHETTINELNSKVEVLKGKIDFLIDGSKLTVSGTNEIRTKTNTYNIKTFSLPFPNNYEWLYKAVAYLEQTDNEIIVASGNGEFFHLKRKISILIKSI